MDTNNHHDEHNDGHIAEAHHPSYGVNILVWIGLLSLTAVTVAVAGINLGSLALTVALIIATVKSLFVVNFFMHVKFDNKVVKIFIGVCMLIFVIVLILTFFDLTFRF
ncbi:MAG: cytochrome C oxidase subunit IV family protein [Ignavibacteria bacterium]|jgi:cytochrome c oxidase subunit 4|nr:cytochrome C oxidase subunit IV family protein [Ignavibacteria bacterium]MBK6879111.1 cytochrome C oxidase subunit IV family protein [Ignavibacteria bacterium]MBK9227066.1 cytochrome C oxidase subunit IV family protein [Ignavibacteria bacterium]